MFESQHVQRVKDTPFINAQLYTAKPPIFIDATGVLPRDAHCTTDDPILTLALNEGFNSLAPFNKAFRDRTGQTPTEFREALQRTD